MINDDDARKMRNYKRVRGEGVREINRWSIRSKKVIEQVEESILELLKVNEIRITRR